MVGEFDTARRAWWSKKLALNTGGRVCRTFWDVRVSEPTPSCKMQVVVVDVFVFLHIIHNNIAL